MTKEHSFQVINEFIAYNTPILQEISSESPELAKALQEVMKELFKTFTEQPSPEITKTEPEYEPEPKFEIGDLVYYEYGNGKKTYGGIKSYTIDTESKQIIYTLILDAFPYTEEENEKYLTKPLVQPIFKIGSELKIQNKVNKIKTYIIDPETKEISYSIVILDKNKKVMYEKKITEENLLNLLSQINYASLADEELLAELEGNREVIELIGDEEDEAVIVARSNIEQIELELINRNLI